VHFFWRLLLPPSWPRAKATFLLDNTFGGWNPTLTDGCVPSLRIQGIESEMNMLPGHFWVSLEKACIELQDYLWKPRSIFFVAQVLKCCEDLPVNLRIYGQLAEYIFNENSR